MNVAYLSTPLEGEFSELNFSSTGEFDSTMFSFLSHLTYDWPFLGMRTFSFEILFMIKEVLLFCFLE